MKPYLLQVAALSLSSLGRVASGGAAQLKEAVNANNHVLNRKQQVSQLGLHLRKEEGCPTLW
jgi:hypothetical protein